jgi:hypothetical protein
MEVSKKYARLELAAETFICAIPHGVYGGGVK